MRGEVVQFTIPSIRKSSKHDPSRMKPYLGAAGREKAIQWEEGSSLPMIPQEALQ
jgi:hypothetical protein